MLVPVPLPPFALERFFARYEFAVRHLLCASDCETMTIEDLLGLEPKAAGAFARLRLGYTESSGAPSLRAAIAGLYSSIAAEDVLVTNGAEEAIFLLMHAVLSAGDEVLVHQPCYQSLAEVARSLGCRVASWQAREECRWELDPDDLPRLTSTATRLIVVNLPHNPTGWTMDQDRFRRTLAFAEERGITLFSDEVYRGLEQRDEDRLPAAADGSASAVSLGVLSKTYGLPGLRIGWIATHRRAIRKRMAELKDYTTICAGGPSEFLAEVALQHASALAARSRGIIRDNLELLDGLFARRPAILSWHRPKAGPVGFPRYLAGDAEAFCADLAERHGVLLAPGSAFGDASGHFRIGFGRSGMPAALAELEKALDRQDHGALR